MMRSLPHPTPFHQAITSPRLAALLIALLLPGWAGAAPAAPANGSPPAPVAVEEPPLLLAAKGKRAQKAPREESAPFSQESVGYLLVDPDSGQVLQSQRADLPFIPASVCKIPSSMAALQILGPEHRFTTSVQVSGSVGNGVLQGDLHLVGGGDPSLTIAGLNNLLAQLRERGIRRVSGRFLYDDSLLVSEPAINDNQSEDETYNTGISALTLEYNRVEVHWGRSSRNRELPTWTNPNLGYVRVEQGENGAGAGRFDYVGEAEGGAVEVWRLNGGSRGGSEWLPIKHPGRYTALMFRHLARIQGIELPYPAAGRTPGSARPVAEHKSVPLANLVDGELEYSNNLTAELVGMAAAAHLAGRPVSTTQAGEILTHWFRQRFPSTDWTGFRLANSSGLSSDTRITPRQMVDILHYADALGREGPRYISLLPISGWKGTLARRLNSSQSQLRVWAKTGSIKYAQALAGTLFATSGQRLLFAVLVSDPEQRARFDQRMNRHTPQEMSQAQGWNGTAKHLIYSLVDDWVRSY